jgi:FkbM family methyltransferase
MKKLILSLLNGWVLPVLGSQLKGLKLRVNRVQAFTLFWKNTEPEKHYAYKIFIKDNDVIFDVGANTGMHSYFFSRNFIQTKVYAFEPLPANADYIRDAISLNKIKNIELINAAVGAKTGEIYFNTAANNSQGFITEQESDLKVKLESLDNFIETRKLTPDFIKIDVEGAESQVLEGFKKQIAQVLPVMIIESHTPDNDRAISTFFQQQPYVIYRLAGLDECLKGKPFLTIKNLNSIWPDPDGVWGNIVAIPVSRKNEYMQFVKD